ncbi:MULTISPECIES: MotA/TolQ/ExbB proton channel family protein [Bacillaceae]|uniref:MotA/TolQ/ExbB proton channel family protein n=1 Tax=Evansella alkalicola TaxID=745819 RepID=A0ABS6K215_9BACI|nr:MULTISPECIES: MotA/TolQ/ExbB proton channel family protein [Bacillaceae]MBU9723582.1 MotA/TolQ/ExbB proton channel family protein [Bacillus alkalicola]
MVETILKIFMSEQQAQSILSNSLIELIFMILFIIFAVTFLAHMILYSRLRTIRNHLNTTNSLDIEPLRKFKQEFDEKKEHESLKVETFVQKKFSGWRVLNLPVLSLIKMVQMTVSVFILVGVLGTFIGLTMSLGSIDATGDQLVENVAAVLTGIDVAFATSIAGMGLSLIMTVLIRVFNTEYLMTDIMLKMESHLEENEQDAMGRLIEVSKSINTSIVELRETNQKSLQNIESAFHGFQEYTVGLEQSAKDLAKFNEGLSANLKDFNLLFNNMSEVTSNFDDGVKNLNKNFDHLFTYFNNMDKRNERMASAFQETYNKISEMSKTQMETLNQFDESVGDWKNYIASISDKQDAIHGAFERVIGQSDNLVKLMKENNKQFKSIFGDDVSSKLTGISTYLRELKGDFDKLGNSIVQLPDALETINSTQAEYKHLLSDRFDDLKQFNQEFNNHLKNHYADSKAFEKQLNDATNSFDQMGMKNSQLLNEINRVITQMTDSFNHRESQIESSVGVLKDILSRYVNNLEGSLGERLDKVSRNIGDYVVDISDSMKKEFKQIGDITEESQQRNARLTQQTISDLSQEFQNLNRQLQSFAQEVARQNSRQEPIRQNNYQEPVRQSGYQDPLGQGNPVRIGRHD